MVLLCFLIRGVTLDGASEGIKFMFYPRVRKQTLNCVFELEIFILKSTIVYKNNHQNSVFSVSSCYLPIIFIFIFYFFYLYSNIVGINIFKFFHIFLFLFYVLLLFLLVFLHFYLFIFNSSLVVLIFQEKHLY